MAKIQYENKVSLIENADIPDINKVKADDMNEIKQVVNENDDKFLTNGLNVSNEVDEDYRVNVLHSKNLFDKSIYTQGNLTTTTPTTRIIGFLKKVSIGDTFTIVNINTNMGFAVGISQGNIQGSTGTITDDSGWQSSQYTITSSQNGYLYLLIRYNNDANITPSLLNNNDFMVNEGSTTLPYEPYITPSINVDGEEIYSKPVVLFSNPSGQFDDISLSDSKSNYSKLEIYFIDDQNYQDTMTIDTSNKPFQLQFVKSGANRGSMYFIATRFYYSGSTIKRDTTTVYNLINSVLTENTTADVLKITKILGYK